MVAAPLLVKHREMKNDVFVPKITLIAFAVIGGSIPSSLALAPESYEYSGKIRKIRTLVMSSEEIDEYIERIPRDARIGIDFRDPSEGILGGNLNMVTESGEINVANVVSFFAAENQIWIHHLDDTDLERGIYEVVGPIGNRQKTEQREFDQRHSGRMEVMSFGMLQRNINSVHSSVEGIRLSAELEDGVTPIQKCFMTLGKMYTNIPSSMSKMSFRLIDSFFQKPFK